MGDSPRESSTPNSDEMDIIKPVNPSKKRAAEPQVHTPVVRRNESAKSSARLSGVIQSMWHDFDSPVAFSEQQSEVVMKFAKQAAEEMIEWWKRDSLEDVSMMIRQMGIRLEGRIKSLEEKVHAEPSTTSVGPSSYADAVAKLAERKLKKPEEKTVESAGENGCYSILQTEDNSAATSEQMEGWTTALSRKQKQYNLRVTKVQATKQNNMAVTFKNREDQKRFEESLGSDPIPGAGIRSSSDRKVLFAIRGVPGNYNAEKLVEELQQRNADHPFLLAEKLDVKDARRIEGNMVDDRRYKTFKLWASSKHANILLRHSEMYINLRRVHVELWRPNERCSCCLNKGHMYSECTQKIACKHCGGEHQSYRCQNSRDVNSHHCVICYRAKLPHKHRAVEDSCPTLKKEIAEIMHKSVAKILANHG